MSEVAETEPPPPGEDAPRSRPRVFVVAALVGALIFAIGTIVVVRSVAGSAKTAPFKPTGSCPPGFGSPQASPTASNGPGALSLLGKRLAPAQLPPGWCPAEQNPFNVIARQGGPAPSSSDTQCESVFEATEFPPSDLGGAQAVVWYEQSYAAPGQTAGSGTTPATTTGVIQEILIQFPSPAEAARQLQTLRTAWAGCHTWSDYAADGTAYTWHMQERRARSHADETVLIDQTAPFGPPTASRVSYALLRRGPYLAYLTVATADPKVPSLASMLYLLPAAAQDLDQ